MPKTFTEPTETHSRDVGSELQRLIYTLFQGHPDGQKQSTCVAFTSALPGEGVSHVVREIGMQLAKQPNKRTLIADSRRLESLDPNDLGVIGESAERASCYRLCMISATAGEWQPGDSSHWLADPQFREDCLRTLGKFFDYILLDCAAISTCAAVVGIAPLVDGVVLVVQAGRTKRPQIKFAQEFLHLANAKILGYVLNKREYPIPEWLHARL